MSATPDALPGLDTRADGAYLDFVEGFRSYILGQGADFESRLDAVVQAEEQRRGRPFASRDEVAEFLDGRPLTQVHGRLTRTQQEMKWQRIERSLGAQREALLGELDRYDTMGPGRLELDPSFRHPPYANVHFHLQPGGYHKHELGGFMYHHGTKVFFRGVNDCDELQGKLVSAVEPPTGKVARILDLACSIGQSTTAWKRRFPEAQVWGIDHSAPMLRAAHRRAVMAGVDVNFSQRLTEDTRFPDAHFDLVFAFILFHELPIRIIRETVREAARVLRPGGIFAVYDFAGTEGMTPFQLYHRWFDARNNGEPYSEDFCDCDLAAILNESGFAAQAVPLGNRSGGAGYMRYWRAERLGA
jgi:SAM-dependent methyltransferase